MDKTIELLRQQMEAAARNLDFEEAKRLRDRIALMQGGANTHEAAAADESGISRQSPGAMGLGTGQPRVTPPAGWKPPAKPGPLTRGNPKRER